jgi:hypothetical protein
MDELLNKNYSFFNSDVRETFIENIVNDIENEIKAEEEIKQEVGIIPVNANMLCLLNCNNLDICKSVCKDTDCLRGCEIQLQKANENLGLSSCDCSNFKDMKNSIVDTSKASPSTTSTILSSVDKKKDVDTDDDLDDVDTEDDINDVNVVENKIQDKKTITKSCTVNVMKRVKEINDKYLNIDDTGINVGEYNYKDQKIMLNNQEDLYKTFKTMSEELLNNDVFFVSLSQIINSTDVENLKNNFVTLMDKIDYYLVYKLFIKYNSLDDFIYIRLKNYKPIINFYTLYKILEDFYVYLYDEEFDINNYLADSKKLEVVDKQLFVNMMEETGDMGMMMFQSVFNKIIEEYLLGSTTLTYDVNEMPKYIPDLSYYYACKMERLVSYENLIIRDTSTTTEKFTQDIMSNKDNIYYGLGLLLLGVIIYMIYKKKNNM